MFVGCSVRSLAGCYLARPPARTGLSKRSFWRKSSCEKLPPQLVSVADGRTGEFDSGDRVVGSGAHGREAEAGGRQIEVVGERAGLVDEAGRAGPVGRKGGCDRHRQSSLGAWKGLRVRGRS